MRAPRERQIGNAGVSAVTAAFELLGWGVAENARHDVGTDLFLLARDRRLFDLGLVVGAQVKTGESWFSNPVYESDDTLTGWWFRDSDRSHIDAWLTHVLPHILILHNLNSGMSYWVHVTEDKVESTGIGAKIKVPLENTIDDDHAQALLEVAATLRPATSWEGSAWTDAGSLLPRDILRHALIVPRLVAPHPNAGFERVLSPEQAVAMLMQARLREVDEFARRHHEVPTLDESSDSLDWQWRFVGALAHRLRTGEVNQLVKIVSDAPDASTFAAATVAATAGLFEEGRIEEAIPLLEVALARDDASPIDHAWLTIQLARARTDIGQIDAAHSAVLAVQAIRMTDPNDVTATAIAGAATRLLFDLSAIDLRKVSDVIAGSDTTASWWRRQTVSWGLAAMLDRTFKDWGSDTSITFGGSDQANDQLLAASLTANHVGDQGEWRYLTGLLGQDTLLRLDRESDPQRVRQGLSTLRLAGDDAALKLAVRRLVLDGPAEAVSLAAAEVRLEASTQTTCAADLTMLREGGDVLDETTADRAVEWLLNTLRDPSDFLARTRPRFVIGMKLPETLASVLAGASVAARLLVVKFLCELPTQGDQAYATAWAGVVAAMPPETWTNEVAISLGGSADAHHEVLRQPLLGLLAQYDSGARERLLEEVGAGSLGALSALGDVRTIDSHVVRDLVTILGTRLETTVRDAHANSFGIGGHDFAGALALLNVWHHDVADWNSLIDFLGDVVVSGRDKIGALRVLTGSLEQIPLELTPRLKAVCTAITHAPPSQASLGALFGDEVDARGPAAHLAAALGVLNEVEGADLLADLLAGDSEKRQWAAMLALRLGKPEDVGILTSLVHDHNPDVRATAASALASLVDTPSGSSMVIACLRHCLRDTGTRVPISIAATLAHPGHTGSDARETLAFLTTHRSARARSAAQSAVL